MTICARALAGATLLCVLAPSAASGHDCAPASSEAAKPRKKGFGLGGVIGAARRAGVGSLLGTGKLLVNGKAAEVAGAVAGSAVAAGERGDAEGAIQGRIAGLAGTGRRAQVAGAVTGVMGELIRNQAGDRSAKAQARATTCLVPAEPAADKAWN